jgi:hypothetical protein
VDTYSGLLVWAGDRYVPGEQFFDAVDGVVGNSGEDVLEIDLRVESVEFGRAEQGVDRRSAFAACVRATKEKILPSNMSAGAKLGHVAPRKRRHMAV